MTAHLTVAEIVEHDGPGQWWMACEFPERQNDEWTIWDGQCAKCGLALEAARRRDPELTILHHTDLGGEVAWVPADLILERYKERNL